MNRPEFPARTCREPIAAGLLDYNCDLIEWHAGPHGTFSNKESMERRDKWEKENPGWEKLGGAFSDPFEDIKP